MQELGRFVTIGYYLPTGSPVHRLDPRARLVGAAALLVAITLAPRVTGLGAALGSLLLLLALARVPLSYALRGLVAPLPFIAVLALLQIALTSPSGATLLTWGPVRVSVGSLLAGAGLVLRFAALILCISLATFTLSTSEMVHGLDALLKPLAALGLPTRDFVMVVQVALRFQPLLAQEAERIVKAQASRGAEWGTRRGGLLRRARRAVPIIVPLFLTTLRRAENLALAMDARGYHSGPERSSMHVLRFRARDALALVICAGLAALVIGL